jgi:hypothetical protein
MASFATREQVAGLWRPLKPAEEIVVDNQLAKASRLVRRLVPDVDARIAADTLDAEVVGDVVVDMVLRVMRNPEGMRSEEIDGYSYTRDTALSAGALYLSDDELALLKAPAGSAFSVRLNPETPTESTIRAAQANQARWCL